MLDDGSTVTLIEKRVASRIGVTGPRKGIVLAGVGAIKIKVEQSESVTFEVQPLAGGRTFTLENVHTISDLNLPRQTLDHQDLIRWPHLNKLPLRSYKDISPTLLIGQDNWDLGFPFEIRRAKRRDPVAIRTNLGWLVHGFMPSFSAKNTYSIGYVMEAEQESNHANKDDVRLHELIKENFQIESLGISPKKRENTLDQKAEQLLANHTTRIGERWQTCLLWKSSDVDLPNNYQTALKRLENLERRMERNPEFADLYCRQIDHFIAQGYASPIQNADQEAKRVWYLPHFGVTHPNKPGKVRVVFDAAAKTQGVSLNDKLLPGPDLLKSLHGVLMRFRQKPIAIVGDIKEMFLQIKIRPEDRQSQRFLWRGRNKDHEPEIYCMTSMIFGSTSSPCSAIYVKNKNAMEFQREYPDAVHRIIHKHYMDDYLDSVDNELEAIRLIKEVTKIHRQGGFEMQRWSSNSQAVLNSISEKERITTPPSRDLDPGHVERTLGLKWNPQSDQFHFAVDLERIPLRIKSGHCRPTKRQMLKVIMSVFDPQGFLAPFIVRSKILLQQVWKSGVNWDEYLQDAELVKWKAWIGDLKHIRLCKIPRCYMDRKDTPASIELHTFCDASEKAFAAVSYWRLVYPDDNIKVAFIASKCRVAPLKPLSIPRMELSAALIGSRLAKNIIAEHEFTVTRRVFWTDSRTVLIWIKSDPRNFKTFVAHRLGEIDELTDANEWRWVPSSDNPADKATKETAAGQNWATGWFTGPSFLERPEVHWPLQPNGVSLNISGDTDELRRIFVTTLASNPIPDLPDVTRFSQWKRLIRATAWILLLADKCRKKTNPKPQSEHLRQAEILWAKQTQMDSFQYDLQSLTDVGKLQPDSNLHSLSPFIDKDGILRIDGRIRSSLDIGTELRMPIILPGRHPYTRLLISHYHHKANHGSTEMMINELRQKYWVTRMRTTARSVAAHCQMCRIQRAKPQPPRMGMLPEGRIAHHRRPFSFCGVDYFGPMTVTIGRRHEKRWGVLFTCLTTRAVHIELASSLSTDATIMALRRMMARRGQPTEIYSDNGTNLRGADAELRKTILELNQQQQSDFAITHGIKWKFIPPSAPHMGGSWEVLVRCVKRALKVVLKERAPKEEVLRTLLAEAEHTINSRPLTHVSVDPRDRETLTPNHFLIGASSGVTVPGHFQEGDLHSVRQWRVSQSLADMFWRRWIREYLPTLLLRKRWRTDPPPLKEGDIVFIMDTTLPRNTWPRGIISAIYPGPDGRIRVVDVRTARGVFTRAVHKIIKLPVAENGTD